jgi:hypothetical protein
MLKSNLILRPVLIVSLMTLLLNDFYLKQAYPNYLTGKLSDFSGLMVFPIFMVSLFPKSKKWISIATGILFIIWKTPYVSPLIASINDYLPFSIHRVVDYSDYWALLVIPVMHWVTNQDDTEIGENDLFLKVARTGLAAVCFFAICATSVAPVELPKGTVYIGEKYTIKKSRDETIKMIKSLGYNVEYHEYSNDSLADGKENGLTVMRYYQTDSIRVYNDDARQIGLIPNVKYKLKESKNGRTDIEILSVTLSEEGNIQRWQTLKHLRKKYKKILEEQMIDSIK